MKKQIKITRKLIAALQAPVDSCLHCVHWRIEDTALLIESSRPYNNRVLWGQCAEKNEYLDGKVAAIEGCHPDFTPLESAHDKAQREFELTEAVKANRT